METKKELKVASKKLGKVFGKIVIQECSMCGAFIPDSEFKQFEGVCKKHWDYWYEKSRRSKTWKIGR